MIQETDYKQIMNLLKEAHTTAWEFICYHEMQVYSYDAQKTRELAAFLYDSFIQTSAADFSLTEAGNYLAENWDTITLYGIAPDALYDLYTGYKDMEDFCLQDKTVPAKKTDLNKKILSAKSEKNHGETIKTENRFQTYQKPDREMDSIR